MDKFIWKHIFLMNIRLFLIIMTLFLFGCQPARDYVIDGVVKDWKYADLRYLDPVDSNEPNQDLIALYTRIMNQSFQVRMDFLNLDPMHKQDIYIILDTNPGGFNQIKSIKNETLPVAMNWDYLITLPASGNITVVDSEYSTVMGLEMLLVRDRTQDNITVSFNVNALPIKWALTRVQILITLQNQPLIVDQTLPISIDAPSPSRAKVLFVFWNTFSSSTPAETLRSWAGAHSGPISSRHGLKYLLDAASETKSTVYLVDMMKPETLSALDYLNVLPRIRELLDQRILGVPDITYFSSLSANAKQSANGEHLPSEIYRNNVDISGNVSLEKLTKMFDIILFNDRFGYIENNYKYLLFYDYAHIIDKTNNCPLAIFNSLEAQQIVELMDRCKELILVNGLLNSPNPLIFGGDFSKSILGDPAISSTFFAYIQNHPWIQVLSIDDIPEESYTQYTTPPFGIFNLYSLGTSNLNSLITTGQTENSNYAVIYEALIDAPNNRFTDMAWSIFSSFSQSSSSDFISLGNNYVGQIGYILAAAKWAAFPTSSNSCNIDLDYDGEMECVLSTNNMYVTIDPEGGFIPFLFSIDDNGLHQIVGPTWEFLLGISDPTLWDLSLGVRSDPDQVLGAFDSNDIANNNYSIFQSNNTLVINYGGNMPLRKSFTISDDSIRTDVSDSSSSSENILIPLVVDPWHRFSLGWGDSYYTMNTPLGVQWGIKSGELLELRSTNPVILYTFNSTKQAMDYPEDPNYDYLPGHYLPYPMALARIKPSSNYSIEIILNP